MAGPPVTTLAIDHGSGAAVVQVRAQQLVGATATPFIRATSGLVLAVPLSGIGTFVVAAATAEPVSAATTAMMILAVVGARFSLRLIDPTFRAALELYLNHDTRERAEWRAGTGTRMPRGIAAAERWLERNPDSPYRASLLLAVGRLDEADRAIDELVPETPEGAFGIEILRRSRSLLAGEIPDLDDLHAEWRDLPDTVDRRHRRECLALLDAQVAVVENLDPLQLLAEARSEVGEVERSARTWWLLAKFAAFAVIANGWAILLAIRITA